MLNNVCIQGRLTADPELRKTTSDVPVSQIRIACDRDYKDKSTGEKKTDFITVVLWRNDALFVTERFKKGDVILVQGRLATRDYTDKNGNNRTATEIQAENVWFPGSARRAAEQDIPETTEA